MSPDELVYLTLSKSAAARREERNDRGERGIVSILGLRCGDQQGSIYRPTSWWSATADLRFAPHPWPSRRFAMDEWEKFKPLSGAAADQFLRYRLFVIAVFLLALVVAALVGRFGLRTSGYDAERGEARGEAVGSASPR
jgi:hypothetical protein